MPPSVIASKLDPGARARRLDSASSDELVRLVSDRAEGNPCTSRSSSATSPAGASTLADAEALADLQLPESLHSDRPARIDTVPEAPRRTMKVASVVGRVFGRRCCRARTRSSASLDDVIGHLEQLRAADLVGLDRRGGPVVSLQARGDPGGRLREHALRRALDAPPPGRPATSRRPSPTRSIATSTCSPTTIWKGDDDAQEARVTSARAADAAQASYANDAAIDYYLSG